MYYIEQNVTCHKPMQEVKRLVHKHATVDLAGTECFTKCHPKAQMSAD